MIVRAVVVGCLSVVCATSWLDSAALAQDAAPLVRMLKSGRLPPERIGNVLGLVFQRGNAEDLAYIFERAVQPDGFPPDSRIAALDGLAAAAATRKVQPHFDATALGKLIADESTPLRLAALRLAGTWHAESLAGPLEQIATDDKASEEIRRTAISALLNIGGEPAKQVAAKLVESASPSLRLLGIAAMADFDLDQATQRAAALVAEGVSGELTAQLLAPFLERQGGTDKLAEELKKLSLQPDEAKLALRFLYAAGRSDAALVSVLSAAAGLNADPPQLNAEQLKALSAEVLAKGDARRGETLFRRADLSCFKCHALSGAGGDIGPDLSPVGSVSPPDYIITSILNPDLSIKENFITRSIVTEDGKIYQGIVADRDDQRVILKEATGEKVTIPAGDIAEEVEGKSLMPKGLAGFLTHQEFLDLVRFVSSLGRPGEYEIRSKPTVQRWRVLESRAAEEAARSAAGKSLPERVANATESEWQPVYAQVAGVLPLDELVRSSSGGTTTPLADASLFLRADLDVTAAGEIHIEFDSTAGLQAWLNDQPLDLTSPAIVTVGTGPQKLYLRVDLAERGNQQLRVLVDKPADSSAAFTIVGGR